MKFLVFCFGVLLSSGIALAQTGIGALGASAIGTLQQAQDRPRSTSADECQEAIDLRLAREQRLYRRVLFGLSPAAEAAPGDVRYDEDGRPWIRSDTRDDGQQWESVEGRELIFRSDAEMDEEIERDLLTPEEEPFRRGIFDTRRVSTSELIPYLTQSMRALQCRTEALSEIVRQSIEVDSAEAVPITVQVPGCLEMEFPSVRECHLRRDRFPNDTIDDAIGRVRQGGVDLTVREEALLKMIVSYDAAYRSVLQTGGQTDAAVDSFQQVVFGTLRQAAEFIPVFGRLPCFSGSCDSAPPQEPDN